MPGGLAATRPGNAPPPPPQPPDGLRAADPRGAVDDGTLEDPLLGALVNGQYRVLRRIGVGGMGAVYLAEEEGMRRRVAIKVMMPRPGDAQDRQRQFQREAQAASKLAHPNIVTVHNFGRLKDGTLFLAMEYIDGRHFGEVLRHERPLSAPRALSVVAQIADAVSEAHEVGIIHRDLKPENIILTRRRGEEVAKILDFGIAKLTDPADDAGQVTRAGLVRGTPRYMSPEQARGERVDRRSDIYSLGVILYVALTGDLPIKADTPFGYLHAHQQQTPTPLRKARPDLGLSASLEALVMRCLAKDPDLRPANMRDVLAALRLEHAKITGATPDPSWAVVAPLPRTRPPALTAAASVMALALAGVLAWWLWPWHGSRAGFGMLETDAPRATGPPAAPLPLRLVEASMTDRPAWAVADLSTVSSTPEKGEEAGVVVIGRSGPVPDLALGRREAEADAAERSLERLLQRFPAADLRLTLRGWIGDGRKRLDGKATYAFKRLLASGPDASMTEVFEQWRQGQGMVLRGDEAGNDEDDPGLVFERAYWERYRLGDPAKPSEFHVVWIRAVLPRDRVERALRRFGAGVRLGGVTAVAAFPLIAWRGGDVRGAMVHRVAEGSPAAAAGVGPGDLIQAVGPRRVRRLSDLEPAWRTSLAEARSGGGTMVLSVRRPGDGVLTLPVDVPAQVRKPRPKSLPPTDIDE